MLYTQLVAIIVFVQSTEAQFYSSQQFLSAVLQYPHCSRFLFLLVPWVNQRLPRVPAGRNTAVTDQAVPETLAAPVRCWAALVTSVVLKPVEPRHTEKKATTRFLSVSSTVGFFPVDI